MIVISTGNKMLMNIGPVTITGTINWYCSWIINPNPPSGPNVDCFVNTTTATTTAITGAPATGYAFQIQEVTIWNNDTISNQISILIQPPASGILVFQCLLPAGYFLRYNNTPGLNQGSGWKICEPFGVNKE